MVCKERLPRIICFSFIFIPGLIFTKSFISANDTANCTRLDDESEEYLDQTESIHCADVYIINSAGIMEFCYQHSFVDGLNTDLHQYLPYALHDFNWDNITCILDMKYYLRCFWNIANLPKNAKYFAYVLRSKLEQHLNCSHMLEKEAVECHGKINLNESKNIAVKVNISLPTLWYIIVNRFDTTDIEKLDPPYNITISKNLKNLEINWTIPEGERISKNTACYTYELKINDEVITLAAGRISYIKQDVDLTRKYAVQLRVKTSYHCSNSIHWSDWSNIHEVGPFEKVYSVNPWVIMAISFLIPMLLLAVLLLCKCQRLTKKLFPPIPSPSVNVKTLLEKEIYCQDFSSRCVEHDTELVLAVEERNG